MGLAMIFPALFRPWAVVWWGLARVLAAVGSPPAVPDGLAAAPRDQPSNLIDKVDGNLHQDVARVRERVVFRSGFGV
jgi:hypothetical protein